MDDEVRQLLKKLLEKEEKESSRKNGQEKSHPAKRQEVPEKKSADRKSAAKDPRTTEEHIRHDLELARREMYKDHEENMGIVREVPIWAKYALTVPEAAKYFHLGYNKLREIVRKDKYADYLLWNGGRVYFKRELFEKYLNGENEV